MTQTNLLKKRVLHYLDELQAIDIVCLDVHQQTSITDEMLICSGRSSRHVKSIAESVQEKMKHEGYPSLSINGLESGEWALIDYGDIIVHIMQPDIRAFYNLEDLWSQDS